jgi:cytochrome b6-f complex iron-sulfur subunit
MTAPEGVTRRHVLVGAGVLAACPALGACSGATAGADQARTATSPAATSPTSGATTTGPPPPLARVADIPPDAPLQVTLPGRDTFGYLVRDGEQVRLLDSTCSHAACAISWEKRLSAFLCPCHLSRFDRHGKVLNPPAESPLTEIPVVVRDGAVTLAS